MSDIVERLRRLHHNLIDPHADRGMRHADRIPVLIEERLEAADEIERLREELGARYVCECGRNYTLVPDGEGDEQ